MQQVLQHAGQVVQQQLSLKGDKVISPSQIPLYFQSDGLYIRADMNGWSWRMLKNTLDGLQYCLFRKGVFHEVYVDAVKDPTALNSGAERHLSLLKFPAPRANNGVDTDAILQRCFDPETRTRLLCVLGGAIGGYEMQEVLDGAQGYVTRKLDSGGDRRLLPAETPLNFRSHGLLMTASFEGWTWQALNHTIGTMRLCYFRRGVFREIDVQDMITMGPSALSGQRRLILKREDTES
ncbi:MAG: hypothetical protein Q9169_004888 [Polycauliona sp. 2 TL-2023]